MFKRILLSITLVFSACSSIEDVPLPITSSNENALAFFNKAVNHFTQGEWREGRDNFQSAIRIEPNFVMANLWGWSDDPVQTRKYREVAVANKDKVSDAERIRVEMWMAQRDGESTKKLDLAKELVAKYPNSSEAYVELGNVYKEQYMLDEAIDSFEKALKINPDSFQAYGELVQLHVVTGNNIMLPKEKQSKDMAVKYAEELIRIRPKAPFAHQVRANIERQNSNFEKADELYQKLIDICNETGSTAKGTALLISAHNLMFGGNFDASMLRYDEAIAIANSPQHANNLTVFKIVAHLFSDKYYEALELLDEQLKVVEETSTSKEQVNNNYATLNWHKMMIQAHNQQRKEAFESLDKFKSYRKIDLDMNKKRDVDGYNATNHAMEAWLYTLFGDYSKAQSSLAKHYELVKNWDNANALDNYNAISGMVYMMQGNPSKALEFFNDRISPANYQYYSYFKALALKATQRTDEADEIFKFIANYNFLSWEVGLTRNLAKKELAS